LLGLVYLIDDHAPFQTSIRRLLEQAGYQVETFSSAQEFLSQLPNEDQAGCILLDVRLPDLSGPELQIRLNELGFALPVIFFTGYLDINGAVRAMKAGAEDVLIKPIKSDELLSAIERAVARHQKSRASRVAMDAHRVRFASLTPREQQVFRLVVRGNVNKQIAHQLGTAQRTVKAHRERIMGKMRVQSFAELVSIAVRVGELND
jgi:FixJ family two-component response regulator